MSVALLCTQFCLMSQNVIQSQETYGVLEVLTEPFNDFPQSLAVSVLIIPQIGLCVYLHVSLSIIH